METLMSSLSDVGSNSTTSTIHVPPVPKNTPATQSLASDEHSAIDIYELSQLVHLHVSIPSEAHETFEGVTVEKDGKQISL